MNCINIYCSNQLTDFDIGKQPPVRQNKYVFCRKCRGGWVRGKILFWRCTNCNCIMTSTSDPLYKKFCRLKCRCESYLWNEK